ncbi:MAG TPA: diguanylate cyclase [Geminicoccaceae bacterium]|nr:diguanylate cyclase [Geminicoccaceae bacterium]
MAAQARVLVFDGPRQALAPLTEWLVEQDFAVHRSDRSEQALAVLGAGPFELVLLDAAQPDGMDLAQAIRATPATRHLAVVIVTSDHPATVAAQALAVGADEILVPPLDEEELYARLTALSRLAAMEIEWLRREAVLRRFGVEPEEPRAAAAAQHPTRAERLQILLVGEASGEQVQVTAALGGGVTATYADGIDGALEILERQDFDAVVLTSFRDPAEPQRLCRWLRVHPRLFDLPVLLIAQPDDVAARGEPYRWGVSDVLYQPLHPAVFRLRAQSWVRKQRLRRRLRGETALRHPPTQDRLTGLYGHGFLHEYLDDLLRHVAAGDPPAALGLFNVVGMTWVNQTRGYVEGDRVLAGIAATLARTARASDLIARLGGDEFAVVLTGCDAAAAVAAAERLSVAVAEATAGIDGPGSPGLALQAATVAVAPPHSAATLVAEARALCRRLGGLRRVS